MEIPYRNAPPDRRTRLSEPVVLAAAAAGLADFIEAHGGDPEDVFSRCGVAPDMIKAPTLHLRLDVFCQLFELAAERTGCDHFGLLFGQQFQPRDLGMWGYAALSAPTLGSALETLAGLFRYQQSSSTMRFLQQDKSHARLEYRIDSPDILARRQDAELSLGQFVNLIRECCGRDWSPTEIQFEHPSPAAPRAHQSAFGAPVFFGCATNAIILDSTLLERPMPTRDIRLQAMMRNCLEMLGPGDRISTLYDQIRDAIGRSLVDGAPTLETISAILRTPPGALRRALADENVSFRETIDQVRFELAKHHLAQRHLPLTEIAIILGYSELSAFTRAFTRWSGVSPLNSRNALLRH